MPKLCFTASALATILEPSETNATSALNQAAASLCANSSSRTIHFTAGIFNFYTAPNPFNCALNLVGEGIGATTLIRRYSEGKFLQWTRGTDHSGGSLHNMTILAGENTNGGMAVYVQALPDTDGLQNSYNRHSFIIDGIIVGRVSVTNTSWEFGLYLDGSNNPDNNSNSIPGIRGIYVDHSTFGGTNNASVYLNKARGIDLHIECYTPLNNSFAGVILDNNTWSVKLDSRNCAWNSRDHTAVDVMFNGTRLTS